MSEEQSSTLAFLPIFGDELPHKRELEPGLVGNPFNTGNGVIYTAAELFKAESVLKAYRDAWAEIVTQANLALSNKPPLIRRPRPVILTAICCLNHGLCHIHGPKKTRHKGKEHAKHPLSRIAARGEGF